MQVVEVQQLAATLHELCFTLDSSRHSGDYAQASQDYWVICHYGRTEQVDLVLLPFQSTLSITLEDVAGKWLDNEIKKAFRQENKTVRRGMKLYQEQYTQRWEEAIAAATPLYEQQRQKTIAGLKTLGEKVEADATKALHWAIEIERLVLELRQHGQPDPFEERRLALAQTIRTKTEHYRHVYLSEIEVLLRANESADATSTLQPAVSAGSAGVKSQNPEYADGFKVGDRIIQPYGCQERGEVIKIDKWKDYPSVGPVPHVKYNSDGRTSPVRGCYIVLDLESWQGFSIGDRVRLQQAPHSSYADQLGTVLGFRRNKDDVETIFVVVSIDNSPAQVECAAEWLKLVDEAIHSKAVTEKEITRLELEILRLQALAEAAAEDRFGDEVEYTVRTSKQGQALLENMKCEELAKRQGQITTLQRKVDRLKGVVTLPTAAKQTHQERFSLHQEVGRLKRLISEAARRRFKQSGQTRQTEEGKQLYEALHTEEYAKRKPEIDALQQQIAALEGKPVSSQLPYLLIIPNAPERFKSVSGMDAIDRYNAPVHQMLRQFTTEHGIDWKLPDCPVDLWVLSSKYSLVPARMSIRSYEREMTPEVAQKLQCRLRPTLNAIAKQRTYAEVYLYLPEAYRAALGDMAKFFPHTPIVLGSGDHSEESLDQLEVWLEKAISVETEASSVEAQPLVAYEGELMPRNAVVFSLVGSQTTFDGVITTIVDQRVTIESHAFPHPVTVERSRIHSKHEWQVGNRAWLGGHVDFDANKDPFFPWVEGTVTKIQDGDCVISCPNYRQGHCSWVWVDYQQKLQDCSGRGVDPNHRDRWVAGLKAKGGILSSDAHTKACNLFLHAPSLSQSGATTEVSSNQRDDDHSVGKADHSLAGQQTPVHDRVSDDRLRGDLPIPSTTVTEPLSAITETPAMSIQTPEHFAPRANSYDRDRWMQLLTSLPVKTEAFKECLKVADQYAIAKVLDDLAGKPGTKSRITALSKQLKHLQETAATVEVEHEGFTGSIQSDPERGLRLRIFGHRGLQQWFRHIVDTESVSEVIAWFKAQVDQDIAAVNADEDKKRVFVGSRNVEDTVFLHQDQALQRQKRLWDALEEGDYVTLNTLPKPEEIRFLETKPVGEIGEWVRVNMGDQSLYHNKLAQVTAIHDEGKALEVRSEDGSFSGAIFGVNHLWKPARTVRYNELTTASAFQVYNKNPGLYLTYEGSEPFRAMASWIEQILPQQEQSDSPEAAIAFTQADLEGLHDLTIPEQITALLYKFDFIDNTEFLRDDPLTPGTEYRGWQIASDYITLSLLKDDRVWDRPLLTEDDPLSDADEETATAYAKQVIDAVESALEKLSGQQLLFDQATPDDASEPLSSAVTQPLHPTPHTPHPRRLIIGDVHGHYDALMQLLELANFTPEDQLYFLGDLIDRGPKSREVIEFVRNGRHHCVLGNHEQLLLDALAEHAGKSGRARLAHWTQNGGEATIYSYVDSNKVTEFVEQMHKSGTVDWLKALPLSISLDDLFLVHAGLRPNVPLEQQEARDLLWIRDDFFYHPTPYFPDKLIVGGHTYTIHLDVEAGKLVKGPGWLNIETGAAFSRSGWLTALDWTNQIVYQVNAQTRASRQLPLDEATVTLLSNYQEQGSTFFHNGSVYDLNVLFAATARRRVQSFDVADLDWILEEEPLAEQERVDRADLTCPILVTRWGDKVLTIDGLHRLTKAKQRGITKLPARIVMPEEMEPALIRPVLEPLPSTQAVAPSGIALGDLVICREHPYAMDDWIVQKLGKNHATCYSASLDEKRKIPLAELEPYTPEKEFPRWKPGDRVQLKYPDGHLVPQQVFEVQYQHTNGMVPVTGANGVEYSFFCFDLELAKVLVSSEVLEAAAQTYSADRLTGAKPTLKGLIEHEAQLWVAVASGGKAPVLGYSWVELVRVIPADVWQEAMQTSDLYSGKQATYQKRQWRLTGNRLRLHLDSGTVEATPQAEAPLHSSTISVPGGEITAQVFQAPDNALQLEFKSSLIALEDYPNGEIIAYLHPWDLEDMEAFPEGEAGIQAYVTFAAEEYHRQFLLNLQAEMERVRPVVRKWLKSIDKTRQIAILTDIHTHGRGVADTKTLLGQYPARTGGDYSDAVKELVIQSIAQEELASLNAAPSEAPFTFDLEPIIANVETEAWWETKAGMAAQCLEANDAPGALGQLNGLKKDDLQRAAERLGLHCSGAKKVMLAEIEQSLPYLTRAAKALATYTSDLLHIGHEYRECSEHLQQAQVNDAAPTAFLTYRGGTEMQISDYLQQLGEQFKARVQQEDQAIPQSVADSYPELVATLIDKPASQVETAVDVVSNDNTTPVAAQTLCFLPFEQNPANPGPGIELSLGERIILRDWFNGDRRGVIASFCEHDHVSMKPDDGEPETFSAGSLEPEAGWNGLKRGDRLRIIRGDDNRESIYTICALYWAINQVGAFLKGTGRQLMFPADALELVPEVVEELDFQFEKDFRSRTLKIDDRVYYVKQGDYTKAANLVITSGTTSVTHNGDWTLEEKALIRQQLAVADLIVDFIDESISVQTPTLIPCLEVALKMHRTLVALSTPTIPDTPKPMLATTTRIAVIGTAGRKEDGDRMTAELYDLMYQDMLQRLAELEPEPQRRHLQSGGSAWADHLAVTAYLEGQASALTLYLPAQFDPHRLCFEDTGVIDWKKNPGGTVNYYHAKFGHALGYNTLADLALACQQGAVIVIRSGLMERNLDVGAADILIAYTWGEDTAEPKAGGSYHTWQHSSAAIKIHVPLSHLTPALNQATISDPTVKVWRLFNDRWQYTGQMGLRSKVELRSDEVACLPGETPSTSNEPTVEEQREKALAQGYTVNINHHEYDIYIGRSSPRLGLRQSKWHNPYKIGKDGTLNEVLEKFTVYLLGNAELMAALPELKGKRKACYCCGKDEILLPDDPLKCHGQILDRVLRGDYAGQELGVRSQESAYDPIKPKPVWFDSGDDIIEGMAIAKNRNTNTFRIAWGQGQESDVSEVLTYWTKPLSIAIKPGTRIRVIQSEDTTHINRLGTVQKAWDSKLQARIQLRVLLDGDEVCRAFNPEEVELTSACDETQNSDIGSQEQCSVTLPLAVFQEILAAADEETLTLHQLRTHHKALQSKLESATESVSFDHTPSLEHSYTWLELLHVFLIRIEDDDIRFPKVLKQVKQALKAEKPEKTKDQPQDARKHLLIIGCAQSKDDTEGLIPAISRYTGPMYKMLAKLYDRDVVQKASVDIWILSAEFGLIPAGEKIPHYDHRMTRDRARELQPQVSAKLKEITRVQVYHEVYIDLGKDYMPALALKDAGLREYFSHTDPEGIFVTMLKIGDGGIGERVSKVKRWLEILANDLPKQIKHLARADKKRLCGAPEGFYYLLGVCPDAGLKHLPNLCPDCLQLYLPQPPAPATAETLEQVEEPKAEPPSIVPRTLNDRLLEALSNGDWQDIIEAGCTDAALKDRIGDTFTRYPNRTADAEDTGWSAEGGDTPKFWNKFYVSLDDQPSIQGSELVRRSRKLLQIPHPKKDQPTEPEPPVEVTYKFEPAKAKRHDTTEILQGSLF